MLSVCCFTNMLHFSSNFYRNHLSLAEASCSASPNDQFLTGLAIGNLGNAYFYLRQYHKAIEFLARVTFSFSLKFLFFGLK